MRARLKEGIGDFGDHLGAAGPEHPGHSDGLFRIGRVAAEAAGEFLLGRVAVGGRDPADGAVRIGHVNHAPVGQVGNGRPGQTRSSVVW